MKKLSYTAILVGATALLLTGCGKNSTVQIGDVVTITYEATFSDGTSRIDTDIQQPLTFTVWSWTVIKKLEESVLGMKAKMTKTIEITPDEGYGSFYDPMKLQKIPQNIFNKTGLPLEKWVLLSLWDLTGVIKGTTLDESGFAFVLFELNPRQTWDTLTYNIILISRTSK
jgi:ABC-type glycerol-3-phosphate transport system substrate-binding protein